MELPGSHPAHNFKDTGAYQDVLVPRGSLPSLLLSLLPPPFCAQLGWAGPGVHFTAEPAEPSKLIMGIMGIGLAEATPVLPWPQQLCGLGWGHQSIREGPGGLGQGRKEGSLNSKAD